MSDFKERMKQEVKDLTDKIDKLEAFLKKAEQDKSIEIEPIYKKMLLDQHLAMLNYRCQVLARFAYVEIIGNPIKNI